MASWPSIPDGVISRTINVNDLEVHIFEAKPAATQSNNSPLIILLHGFPEIAYSWRKIIKPLSKAGYHVVAPDQRGYGRTKRRTVSQTHDYIRFEDDPSRFRMLSLASDVVNLVYVLGYQSVAAVVGHDYGSIVAGYCALIRPDLFKSIVMMSAPFTGAPTLGVDKSNGTRSIPLDNSLMDDLRSQLAELDVPRKHYTMYYSTPQSNKDMIDSPQGLHSFLRAYFHVKSADWALNNPYPLPSFSGASLALLPNYYVMPLEDTMPGVVARDEPSDADIEKNSWLTEEELGVYVTEYSSTGFQGGLNRYRCMTDVRWSEDLLVFSGKRIEVPAMFIAGKKDWGVYQQPGAVEKMKHSICENMQDDDFVLVDGAGHWVQQEAPFVVVEHLIRFLQKLEGK